jgi:protein disulfide-isomerase A1
LKQEFPALGLADTPSGKKYPYDQTAKIAKADVEKWLDSFVDGTLLPNLKSEPIPETNDEPVKVVVGKTYESIVLDKSKDVFIEFYARNFVQLMYSMVWALQKIGSYLG